MRLDAAAPVPRSGEKKRTGSGVSDTGSFALPLRFPVWLALNPYANIRVLCAQAQCSVFPRIPSDPESLLPRCEAASRFLWPPPYPAIYYRSLPEDVISLNCDKYAIRPGVCRETERNRFCCKTADFRLFLKLESGNSLVPGGFLPGDDPSPTSGRKSVFPSTCQLQILHNRLQIPVFPLSGDDPSPACC